MNYHKLPKNVIIANENKRNDDEEESLKELYQELDLKNLILVAIDARKPNFRNIQAKYPPYSGEISQLENLSKEMTFFELLEKISLQLQWPIDEIRLWDQVQYEEFIEHKYDAFNPDEYREYTPKFITLDENEVVFPLFLSDQYLIAERFTPSLSALPNSLPVEEMTQNEWWLSIVDEWNGRQPKLNKTIYENAEVVRIERNKRNNSLFNALGYLLHNITNVKGEQEVNDMREGIQYPSRFRAHKMRAQIARYVADNWEELVKTELLGESGGKDDLGKAKSYLKRLLSPDYSGGDLELSLAALSAGVLVQLFDVPKKRLRQFGRKFVERFGNPDRLGPRFAIKLIRWNNNTYDPLTFSMQAGMDPDRREDAFNLAYVKIAFNWMKEQSETQISNLEKCSNCEKMELREKKHSVCADCHTVYYCDKTCQLIHWRDVHRGVCQSRDFKKESQESFQAEKELLQELFPEIEKRLKKEIGISHLRKLAEGFGPNDETTEKEQLINR